MIEIEPKEFNESCKYVCSYEGAVPLVRTGTVKTTALKSFCNALLNSCSKKFIMENDEEKIRSIDKLEGDFILTYRNDTMFADFFNDLTHSIHTLLSDFYNFLNNINTDDNSPLLLKLLLNLFDDDNHDDKNKVNTFMIVRDIFSVNDLKKVTKGLKKKMFNSPDELKSSILKDIKNLLKFQDILEETDIENSRHIKLNTLLLVDYMFDICVENLKVPEFNPSKADEKFFKIATSHFQYNIFTLDSSEAITIYEEYNPKLKSIILLSFNNKYFEIIGKLRQGNIINRQFFPYEDVIQSILYHKNN